MERGTLIGVILGAIIGGLVGFLGPIAALLLVALFAMLSGGSGFVGFFVAEEVGFRALPPVPKRDNSDRDDSATSGPVDADRS